MDDTTPIFATTCRPTVSAMEDILGAAHPVLDHGFVRLVDYMGNDDAIVQAARVSYGRGTKTVQDDRGLIRYMVRARHTSPLEMCEIKFHVKLPIFVARQWIRHRTANVNEYSARYSILDNEFYIPAAEHIAVQSTTNRQGRGQVVSPEYASYVQNLLRNDARACYEDYHHLLNDDGDGNPVDLSEPMLARELARMNLTLNFYTQWYWKVDLHNLLHFLSLRADPHAQYEIRAYTDVICKMVAAWVPHAWEAFCDYRLGAATFSREEVEILTRLLHGESADVLLPASSMSLRERKEFRAKLNLPAPGARPSREG